MLYVDSGDGPMPWDDAPESKGSPDEPLEVVGVAMSYTVERRESPTWSLTISARSSIPSQQPRTCKECGSQFVLLREITIFGVTAHCQPTGLNEGFVEIDLEDPVGKDHLRGVAVVRPFQQDNFPDGVDLSNREGWNA